MNKTNVTQTHVPEQFYQEDLNVRAELSSTVNLLVTRITQDPQGKRDFAPSGKDVISFCVKTLEFL